MAKIVGSERKASEKNGSNLRSSWMVMEVTKQRSHWKLGSEVGGDQFSQASKLDPECGFQNGLNRPKFCQKTPASFLGHSLQLINRHKTPSLSAYFKVK